MEFLYYVIFAITELFFVSVAQVLVSFASVLRFVGEVRELVLPFENIRVFGFSSLHNFNEESLFSNTLLVLDSIPSDNLP